MPFTMRQLRLQEKKLEELALEFSENKKLAVNILYSGCSQGKAMKETGLSNRTVFRLSAAMKEDEKSQLKRLLSPTTLGRKKHLTNDEENEMSFVALIAAACGSAVSPTQVRGLAGAVA